MKKFIFSLVLSFLLLSLLSAQDKKQSEPGWTIEKIRNGAKAEWTIENHTAEEIFMILVQILYMNSEIIDKDMQAGSITARIPGAQVKFMIISTESGINLIGKWVFVPGEKVQLSSPFSQAKKFFNVLFSEVKKTLMDKT